jgi:hypothetical protein
MHPTPQQKVLPMAPIHGKKIIAGTKWLTFTFEIYCFKIIGEIPLGGQKCARE